MQRLVDGARDAGDDDLGDFVWLAAITGARRGELCGLQWEDLDVEEAVLSLARGVIEVDGELIVKAPKSHQSRRVALDAGTVELLRFDVGIVPSGRCRVGWVWARGCSRRRPAMTW